MQNNTGIIRVDPQTLVLEESAVDNPEIKLTITNLKPSAICYKIKSTAVEKATAKPAFGCIAAFGSEKIVIKAKKFAFDSKERNKETLLIKVAVMIEGHNLNRLSSHVMKQAFSSADTTEMKIALIFQAKKKYSNLSKQRVPIKSSFEEKLNQNETINALGIQKNRNISMYGDCIDTKRTQSKRTNEKNVQNGLKKEISEDSCLGTASDPCNKKINSEHSPDNLRQQRLEYLSKYSSGNNYLKHENGRLSDVETATDSDSKYITPIDTKSVTQKEKLESSEDEKEANIKLWANSASMNNNMTTLEKSILRVEKEIRDTDESVILLSEKVHAKSKLITSVQRKVLEQKRESEEQMMLIFDRLNKLDQAVKTLQAPVNDKCKVQHFENANNENYTNSSQSSNDENLMSKSIILSSAMIVGAFCVSKFMYHM